MNRDKYRANIFTLIRTNLDKILSNLLRKTLHCECIKIKRLTNSIHHVSVKFTHHIKAGPIVHLKPNLKSFSPLCSFST